MIITSTSTHFLKTDTSLFSFPPPSFNDFLYFQLEMISNLVAELIEISSLHIMYWLFYCVTLDKFLFLHSEKESTLIL